MFRKISRLSAGAVWLAAALCCVPVARAAAPDMDAPSRVARGDAFPVIVRTQTESEVLFHWRGKSYRVPTVERDGVRSASLLLPVPVDAKEEALTLSVGFPARKQNAGRLRIALYDKKRPVQKLTVDKKFVTPPAGEQARIAEDRRKVRETVARYTPKQYWSLPFLRPVPGGISSLFGMKRVFNGQPRSVHRGLDLRGAKGTPVRAAADGMVALVDNLYFSGNVVYIDHGLGVFTAYLHMSATDVRPGQTVRRGDIIGRVGATGRVTGPHLHLSLIVQGTGVDPLPLLEKTTDAPR